MDLTLNTTTSGTKPVSSLADLGLNNRMMAVTSPLLRQGKLSGYDFNANYEVDADLVRTSKIYIDQFVKYTPVTYSTADFTTGTTQNITSIYAFDPPNKFKPFVGIPYTSVYEGTVKTSAYELYPIRGASVSGTYTVTSGFNYQAWLGTASMVYQTQVTRNAGTSSQQFTYAISVAYLDYVANAGTTV